MCVDIVVNVELVTSGVLDDNGGSHCVDEVISITYERFLIDFVNVGRMENH